MSTVTDRVRGRVDVSLPTLGVAVGDLLAIGTFVVLGELSHGIDPLANPMLVADTFAPFYIAWLVVSLPAGLYAASLRTDPRRMVLLTAGAWLLADAGGQLLRATPYFHGGAALSFAAVVFFVGGTLLVGWRAVLAVVSSRRRSTVPA